MAWETRGGRRYYYEKKRVDGRVVSKYVGRGLGAQLAESVNQIIRIEREELRKEMRRQAEIDRAIDAQIKETRRAIRLLTEAALIAAGYHRHKGEWRRKRGGTIAKEPARG